MLVQYWIADDRLTKNDETVYVWNRLLESEII